MKQTIQQIYRECLTELNDTKYAGAQKLVNEGVPQPALTGNTCQPRSQNSVTQPALPSPPKQPWPPPNPPPDPLNASKEPGARISCIRLLVCVSG